MWSGGAKISPYARLIWPALVSLPHSLFPSLPLWASGASSVKWEWGSGWPKALLTLMLHGAVQRVAAESQAVACLGNPQCLSFSQLKQLAHLTGWRKSSGGVCACVCVCVWGRGPTPTCTSSWKDSSESLNFSKETACSIICFSPWHSSQGQENGKRQRSSSLLPAFRPSPRMYLSGFHSPLKAIEQRKVYKRAFQVEGIEWAKSQKQESTRNFITFCYSAGIFTGLPIQSLL